MPKPLAFVTDSRDAQQETHELVVRLHEMCVELEQSVAATRRCLNDARALLELVDEQLHEDRLSKP